MVQNTLYYNFNFNYTINTALVKIIWNGKYEIKVVLNKRC